MEKHIIVLGTGHLAAKTIQRFEAEKIPVLQMPNDEIVALERREQFAAIEDILHKYNWKEVLAVCIVDGDDSINLNLALIMLSIASVPIYVSLDNKYLTPYLRNIQQDRLTIFNPASLAAPVFVDTLLSVIPEQHTPVTSVKEKWHIDRLLWGLGGVFLLLIIIGTLVFHLGDGLSWIDALYFTVTTIATVGYGDINLLNAPIMVKLFGVFLMLTSTVLVWVFFSFIIDRLIKKRYEIALGKKKYRLKNHVIVCGLGRLGHRVSSLLIDKGKEVIAIESNHESSYIDIVKDKGAYVFVGDASITKNLIDAGIYNAAGVIVAIDDELKAIEVGLNAKSLNPQIPVIFRVYGERLADKLKSQMRIRHAFSTTTIAAEHLVEMVKSSIQH